MSVQCRIGFQPVILDKYADEGVGHIEDIGRLRIQPFSAFGTLMQIIKEFGGRNNIKRHLKTCKSIFTQQIYPHKNKKPHSNNIILAL